MADDKKYYYLKLKENFYDSEEMIILQNMPDGYLYSDVLMKLYLRSLKTDGKLMFKDRIPYNSTILSQVVRHNVGVVEKALNIFVDLGLIEILDNGAIYMLDIQNFIGLSSSEADRKRQYRKKIDEEKQKLIPVGQMIGQTTGQMSDKNPPEIELEKDLELVDRSRSSSREQNQLPLLKTPERVYEENIGMLSPFIAERIQKILEDGITDELLSRYIEISVERNKKTWSYIEKMARGNLEKNIKTLSEYDSSQKEWENQKEQVQAYPKKQTRHDALERSFKILEEEGFFDEQRRS